jgi:hypothetical protein
MERGIIGVLCLDYIFFSLSNNKLFLVNEIFDFSVNVKAEEFSNG